MTSNCGQEIIEAVRVFDGRRATYLVYRTTEVAEGPRNLGTSWSFANLIGGEMENRQIAVGLHHLRL